MSSEKYVLGDFENVAAGAAILASGGGGSYLDAVEVLAALGVGWQGSVTVADYDGTTDACVLAMMGSPDAATSLGLDEIRRSFTNTLATFGSAVGRMPGCLIPVEIGPVNSIVPLIAAADLGLWVVDGDGAGRAVPELPQTTYGGSARLPAAPCALANDASLSAKVESALLNAASSARIETQAGGIVSAFGSFSGIALWPSNATNSFALCDSYIPGTMAQARDLGRYLRTATNPPSTAEVAKAVTEITGRLSVAPIVNFYITNVSQTTSSASLDAGLIRLDNTPDPAASTETCTLYNLNENLIAYSSTAEAPLIVAPDSICYYSETTGRGFSNATNDLAQYYDFSTGKSKGRAVSLIKVETAPALYRAPGVLASFAGLLRQIGYAGALPNY
jgi:DUF917 family protein